jgi:aldose 1-epimerase
MLIHSKQQAWSLILIQIQLRNGGIIMKITKNLLGIYLHECIYRFTLVNDNNIRVSLLSYGGTITEIAIPDKKSGLQNIVLSFENWEDYIQNPLYSGSNLGPNAGRIRDGKITIGSCSYTLSKNDGNNNLHGGIFSVSYTNWNLKDLVQKEEFVSLTLSTALKDGQDGFPGNRQIYATYTLDNSDRFTLHYQAASDRDTYFNLSNHTYFNLSGDFSTSGMKQILSIKAENYIANNEEHLPEKVNSVNNSPFDFRKPISLKNQIQKYPYHPQIILSKGYNNGFDIQKAAKENNPVLSLWDSKQVKRLHLFTDAPCLVLYSGGFIGKDYKIANSIYSSEGCAIALEAQDFPDAFHLDDYSIEITKKGEIYKRIIVYEFLY